MAEIFNRPEPVDFETFCDWSRREYGRNPSTIRISLGLATNFDDVYRFMRFLSGFVDKPDAEIQKVQVEYPIYDLLRDSA